MKYNEFKKMMRNIRSEINYLTNLPGQNYTYKVVDGVMNMIICHHFWDDQRDMPSCNYDCLRRAVANTVSSVLLG